MLYLGSVLPVFILPRKVTMLADLNCYGCLMFVHHTYNILVVVSG